MSVQVAGNNANIWPQAKYTSPDNNTNIVGSRANQNSAKIPMPSKRKAMSIVFSRPARSDSQPKNGRERPLSTRPSDNAKPSAGKTNPRIDTGIASMPKSRATGASCAVTVRPPVPTMTNIAYRSQKGTDFSTSGGRSHARFVLPVGQRDPHDQRLAACAT